VLLPVLRPDAPAVNGRRAEGKFLFNGYLFVRCRMSDEIYMNIKVYKGVVMILGKAYRVPLVLEDWEMATLKALLACDPGRYWPAGPKAA